MESLNDDDLLEISRHLSPTMREIARLVSRKFFRAIPPEVNAPILTTGIAENNAEYVSLGILRRSDLDGGCMTAVVKEDIALLGRLLDDGYPCPPNAVNLAVLQGNLAMLKCLREHEQPWSPTTIGISVVLGHVDIFKYAWENGCPADRPNVYCMLVKMDSREIIQWLYSRGDRYPVDKYSWLDNGSYSPSITNWLCWIDSDILGHFRANATQN